MFLFEYSDTPTSKAHVGISLPKIYPIGSLQIEEKRIIEGANLLFLEESQYDSSAKIIKTTGEPFLRFFKFGSGIPLLPFSPAGKSRCEFFLKNMLNKCDGDGFSWKNGSKQIFAKLLEISCETHLTALFGDGHAKTIKDILDDYFGEGLIFSEYEKYLENHIIGTPEVFNNFLAFVLEFQGFSRENIKKLQNNFTKNYIAVSGEDAKLLTYIANKIKGAGFGNEDSIVTDFSKFERKIELRYFNSGNNVNLFKSVFDDLDEKELSIKF